MTQALTEQARARAHEGMEIAAVAAHAPDRPAVYSPFGNLTFGQLNARANQVANRLRDAGLQPGDGLALACGNRPEFVVVRFAAHRLGLRLTTVNWHLAPSEVAYIVDDCDAKALFMDVRLGDAASLALECAAGLVVSVAIGGDIPGYESWPDCLRGRDEGDIDNPCLGTTMLYTSGTTGRPKGVLRKQPDPAKAADSQALLTAVFQFDPESGDDLALTTAPLYHAGPFNLCMTTPLTAGIGCVLMDKWSPERTLEFIERYGITHTFFVPTMMRRLLGVDKAVRAAADVSSVRFVIHGGAPCPVEVKHDMLDWFGPVIWEMFAGTEGPGTIVSPQEWLSRPGTVGRPGPDQVRVLDEEGDRVSSGQPGYIYIFSSPDSTFSYYKDADKTERAIKDGYFTAGDIGYLDDEGYLFLTGRSAEVIISGGVNIYPQEIDDVLMAHPAVADVACVGVPDEDLGETVKAVVQLVEDFGHGVDQADAVQLNAALSEELIASCHESLAKQKWPRSVDFVAELPRSATGKVLRTQLRDRYWQ